MDEKYFAKKVEEKWQRKWAETKAFEAAADDAKPKFYQLEMLPYPSGNLHMGHVRNYTAGDVVAWYRRLTGYNVLHPIGWDSFGQPAEDAAIKRGVDPREWTEANIVTMQGQLRRLGISYDWSRQMAAHRPDYYQWDQWFFLKMFEKGLAYKKLTQVNWCETDQATLSNEQASGGLCWRCGNPVTKKDLEQWFLKTTAYSDQLVDGMAEIESGWPSNVIKRQRDWIGRSKGAYVDFKISVPTGQLNQAAAAAPATIRIFTTRIDTIYGANAVVTAPEHPAISARRATFSQEVNDKIDEMVAENLKPRELGEEVEKDGIDTGLKAINPFSNEPVPVWVGNYVMMDYGTGAVMSVPAHDERDFDFAKKFELPIRQVISEPHLAHEHHTMHALALAEAYTDHGVLVHSDFWNGKTSEQAIAEMTEHAVKNGFGEAATTYRLRDWGISRQRFWGAPIPIIYCNDCGVVCEKYENLPIELPNNAPITGTGESPLAKVPEFLNTMCPSCGGPARRETDTMDTFVDSSWYFFRYTDPKNPGSPVGSDAAEYWTPVDQYIGGDDHAVMHLIYARFWTKVMRDLGLVSFNEPFKRLLTQGMVVGETFFDDSTGKRKYFPPDQVDVHRDAKGKILNAFAAGGDADKNVRAPLKHAIERMSKSKGNGVDPDEMVEIYGADAARLFVMFAAPIENELVWNEAGIEGAVRFLQRVWRQVYKWKGRLSELAAVSSSSDLSTSAELSVTGQARRLRQKTHQTIKRVGENLDSLQFNTPVAALMELSNAIGDLDLQPDSASDPEVLAVREAIASLALMLAPFAPHAAEEIYAVLIGNEKGITANEARFPVYSAELAKADEIEIPVQVNGKLRAKLNVSPDILDEDLREAAKADPKVLEYTAGKEIAKIVVVPKRLVSIVVK
ncbi:MAG TPA: leucine--tRNA ligase [Pyrinomonadaceae bacterium]|mgnify:CR=1 FL=1|nr:leucine--tRNA ligase [Pyrinomonadaceae bacterium]